MSTKQTPYRLYDPVYIVGPGRCGTSSMAELVQSMGIYLGQGFSEPVEHQPKGDFEDNTLKQMSLACLTDQIQPREWLLSFEQWFIHHRAMRIPWGAKSPHLAHFMPKVMEYSPNSKVIRCMRPIADIRKSMMKCYNWTAEYADKVIQSREEMLTQALADHDTLVVQLSEWKTPTKVKSKVREYLGELVHGEELPKPKVLMAVPNLGEVHTSVVETTHELAKDSRVKMRVCFPAAMPLEVNRNRICKELLAGDDDYLLSIDSDNPPKKNPLDLLFLGKDIVGYPTRMHSAQGALYNTFITNEDDDYQAVYPVDFGSDSGLMKIGAVGTGCVLIKREVIEALWPFPFELLLDETGTHKVLGSDLHFCKKARGKGFEIWAHFEYCCSHYKCADLDVLAELGKKQEMHLLKRKDLAEDTEAA